VSLILPYLVCQHSYTEAPDSHGWPISDKELANIGIGIWCVYVEAKSFENKTWRTFAGTQVHVLSPFRFLASSASRKWPYTGIAIIFIETIKIDGCFLTGTEETFCVCTSLLPFRPDQWVTSTVV
jgi:hypothetical protein